VLVCYILPASPAYLSAYLDLLGLVLIIVPIHVVSYLRGLFIFIAQLAGAIAASAVVLALQGSLDIATDLGPNTSVPRGLFMEMFLTAQLVFTIFMLAAEKHRATFIAPVGIGLSLFIAELMGVVYTGGSLNPARSFGPCVVTGIFPKYHWIYWIGPILGSLLASGFYVIIKALEYETVNPGQDNDSKPISTEKDLSRAEREVIHGVNGSRGRGDQPPKPNLSRATTYTDGGPGSLTRHESTTNRDSVTSARNLYKAGPGLENGRMS
jgi:aquaporin related protein